MVVILPPNKCKRKVGLDELGRAVGVEYVGRLKNIKFIKREKRYP